MNVQSLSTKKIDSRLKKSLELLICSEQPLILMVQCEGVILNSDLGQLVNKICMKDTCWLISLAYPGVRVFCTGKDSVHLF